MTATEQVDRTILSSRRELELRRLAAGDIVRVTPVFSLASLTERCGGAISVKAENLQRTGSFKLRGALSKLGTLDPKCREVVTGSAGNHAQALAYAARTRGIGCSVYMPTGASVAKIGAVEAFGATVLDGGESVDAASQPPGITRPTSAAAFVHPFDDADVVAGQAGVGLELLDAGPGPGQSGRADRRWRPGRGRRARDQVDATRSRDRRCPGGRLRAAGRRAARASSRPRAAGATIADGIAIKRPGELTLAADRTAARQRRHGRRRRRSPRR